MSATITPATAAKRVGNFTVAFDQVRIAGRAAVVGPHEGKGNLTAYFDHIAADPMWGESSAERAERHYLRTACRLALEAAGVRPEDVNYFLAGDLLNQLITSNFVAHSLGIPFYGLFNACATIAEGLALGAALVDGGFADRVLVGASSHYQTAERQYRYPIELNVQRKPTNHWTTTGAGAALLARDGAGPRLSLHTAGRVIDYGLKDVNDMGSAMAPAAADTLLRHLADTGRHLGDYDLILTGDLGRQGSKMFRMLVKEAGITLGGKHKDGGVMMFKPEQQAGAGASGAACSATVIFGYAIKEMERGRYRRVLCLPTGSLHSPLSYQQGESIPTISHAVVLEW